MEFWLSYNNGAEKLQLPVNPPNYEVLTGLKNSTLDSIGIGELLKIGKNKLKELKPIVSFFPYEYMPYCQYQDILKPYEYVAMIEKWRELQVPIRIIITDTPVNMAVAIEDFNYGERAGSRDVDYTLSLKEYKFYQLTTSKANPQVQKMQPVVTDTAAVRKQKKAPEGIYTVKPGDTYWKIAKIIFGDGSMQKDLKNLMLEQGVQMIPGQKVRV